MAMASQGQPSRKEPSGPLLVHFLQPMHRMGSTWIRPKGGWSSSGIQNMQSSTGQYSTQAGDPAQPVQHSVITASSFGFFLRGVVSPVDLGSNFSSSGTIPAALFPVVSAGISCSDYTEKPAILLREAAPPRARGNKPPQAATFISPARKRWENSRKMTESRRDDTIPRPSSRHIPPVHIPQFPPIRFCYIELPKELHSWQRA